MSAIGSILGSALVTASRGAASAVGDGLSFASELLRAVGGQPTEAPKEAEAQAAAQEAITAQIDALRDRIRKQLSAAGIKLKQPVTLASDSLGRIAVAGTHPQADEIAAALDTDIVLAGDFQDLAGGDDAFSVTISP